MPNYYLWLNISVLTTAKYLFIISLYFSFQRSSRMSISLDMLYNSIYLPGFAAVFLANHFWLYKYNISKLRALIYNVLMIGFGFWGSHLGAYFYNWVHRLMDIPGEFTRTIFGTIITVVVVVLIAAWGEKLVRKHLREKKCKDVSDISVRDTYDMIQPGAMILILTTKCRCLWNGCCGGIPCSWSSFQNRAGENVFPVQITEIIMSACIIYITYRFIHMKHFRRGTALFFAGGLWCFGRFFLEFLMYYPDYDRDFLGFFTLWQLVCVFIIAICVTVIVILYKRYPAEPRPKTKKKTEQKIKRKTKKHH